MSGRVSVDGRVRTDRNTNTVLRDTSRENGRLATVSGCSPPRDWKNLPVAGVAGWQRPFCGRGRARREASATAARAGGKRNAHQQPVASSASSEDPCDGDGNNATQGWLAGWLASWEPKEREAEGERK